MVPALCTGVRVTWVSAVRNVDRSITSGHCFFLGPLWVSLCLTCFAERMAGQRAHERERSNQSSSSERLSAGLIFMSAIEDFSAEVSACFGGVLVDGFSLSLVRR